MRSRGFRKLFVAALLTLCVGIYVLEMSGHWDRTIQDTNDEAGIVAIVLCVGVALFSAGTLLSRIRPLRKDSVTPAIAAPPHETPLIIPPISTASPPIRLRV